MLKTSAFSLRSAPSSRRLALRVQAVLAEGPSPTSSSPASTADVLALKEWNVTCAAMGEGCQTVLLRKGGISEPTFTPRARNFLMFPTKFHTDKKILQEDAAERYQGILDYAPGEQLDFDVVGEVTGAWTTFDPRILELTTPLHIWNEKFLETRLKWRPKQPITVLEVRARRLSPTCSIPSKKDYFGCFSWVELQEALPGFEWEAAAPVLSDEAFAAKQRQLREALRGIEATPLEV